MLLLVILLFEWLPGEEREVCVVTVSSSSFLGLEIVDSKSTDLFHHPQDPKF